MEGKRWTRLTGVVLVAVGLLLVLGGASTTALADPSEGAITGTVTDALTHSGLPGIEVCAEDPNTFDFECDTTDGTGSYTITGLVPDEYTIRFYGGTDYVGQYFDGVTDYNDAELVQVAVGTTTTSIDAEMQVAAKITGTVTDAITHAPVEGVIACASKIGESFDECGFTEADGTYEIDGLEPGSYKVRFHQESSGGLDSSGNYLAQYYNDKRQESEADPISVTTGHVTAGIDAAMHEGGIITGVVTDAVTSDPLPYAWVCASHYEEEDHDPLSDRCTEAEANGSYLIAGLSTGDYAIYSDHVPAGPLGEGKLNYAPQFYSDKPSFETATPFHVTEQQTYPGLDFAMHAGATISGTVVDAETHQPVPDVSVHLFPTEHGDYSDYPAFGYDQTGADGHFEIVGYPTSQFFMELVPFGSSEGTYPTQYLSGKASSWSPGVEELSLVAGHATTLGNVELFKEVGGTEPEEESEPSTPDPGSGGGTGTGPSGSPPSPAGLSLPGSTKQPVGPMAGKAIAVKAAITQGSVVRVALRCQVGAACRGVVKLLAEVQSRRSRRVKARARKRRSTIVIGRSRFVVAAGRQATIRVRLNRKGKQLIRRSDKHGLKVRLTGRGIKPRVMRLKRKPGRRHKAKKQHRSARRLSSYRKPKVRMINPFYEGIAVVPPKIRYFDNTTNLPPIVHDLNWHSWGGPRAEATGLNEKGIPVEVALSAEQRCGLAEVRFYTRITVDGSTYPLQCKVRILSGENIGGIAENVDDFDEPISGIAVPKGHLRSEADVLRWSRFGRPTMTSRGVGTPWWTFPDFRWAPAKVVLSKLGYCRQRGAIAYLKVRLVIYGNGIEDRAGDRVQRHAKKLRSEVGKPGPRHVVQYNYRKWCSWGEAYPEEVWKEWR